MYQLQALIDPEAEELVVEYKKDRTTYNTTEERFSPSNTEIIFSLVVPSLYNIGLKL
jgi:hypothetical protein